MTEPATGKRPRGCVRWGCFGCAVLVLVPALVVAVLAGSALLMGRPEEKTERPRLTRTLPRPARLPSTPGLAEQPPGPTSTPVAALGRVILDISMAQFEIVPGDPGEAIRVDGRYDSGAFELTEDFQREGELGWIYRLEFKSRVSWLRLFGEHDNRVRLVLPRDVPFSLEGAVGMGESDLELGGLWITEADLHIGIGEHEVRFSEPSPAPMGRFTVRSSMGETRVEQLGNASPAVVSTTHGVGAFLLDLSGAWRNDGEIDARCGMGECVVRVPREVNVEVDEVGLLIGEKDLGTLRQSDTRRDDWPTLRIQATSKIGELRVGR